MTTLNKIFKNLTLYLLALIFISGGCKSSGTSPKSKQYLIMLSMDGFRWDYASRVETPNLDQIAEQGVKAEYVKPVFPTKTFPNHYAMATGLYADNHGIVNNNFYCPKLDAQYRISDRQSVENGDFYHGEPIWVTAEKQGMKTASFFWVGSEAPVKGIQPTWWKKYDGGIPFHARIDSVINWMQLPENKRPQLITLYFDEPDRQGHYTGPESVEVDQMVIKLDSLVGVLTKKLQQLPEYENINLIITSDHGMGETSSERYINLHSHTPKEWFERIHGGNPMYSVQPKSGMEDSVINKLRKLEHIKVLRKAEIPERLHYGSNPRIDDLIILADTTWSIGWEELPPGIRTGGAHGWDNHWRDMHTIFYAMGPAFLNNHQHPPIEVVDLYPLIAEILNLEPENVDGNTERIEGMLVRNKPY